MYKFLDTISPFLGYLIPMVSIMSIDGEGEGGGAGGGEGGGAGAAAAVAYAPAADIASDPIFTKYATQDSRDRALIGAQKFMGREKIPVPSGPEDKEAISLLHKTLGLPGTPEEYAIPTDLEIPKDLPIDENLITNFRGIAHTLGMSPQQFAGVYKWYMGEFGGQFTQRNETNAIAGQEAETALRTEWGAAYTQNVALANKVFDGFLDDKTLAEFRSKGLGDNPILVKLFANIGKVLSEDQLQGKPSQSQMSPDEAQDEINKMEGDLNSPLYKVDHPQHKEYVEKKDRLYKFLTGE